MRLINQRTEKPVATVVELAHTRATRRKGLLGRDGLPASHALLLSPCFAVHTAFMRFAIDVAFVDRRGRVVKIVRNLAPGRMALSLRAHAVVELAAGGLGADVTVGDRVFLDPVPDDVTIFRAPDA
jgi:uncharacterized membrane protein (UPF0127 family)